MKDFKLCEKAQQNRERGMYREGILNPNKENEVVSYQRRVRECVYKQFEAGKEKEMTDGKIKGMSVEKPEGAVIASIHTTQSLLNS